MGTSEHVLQLTMQKFCYLMSKQKTHKGKLKTEVKLYKLM